MLPGDAEVAGQGDAEAGTGRCPVDRCHRRLGHFMEQLRDLLLPFQPGRIAYQAIVLDRSKVTPRTEGAACTRHHHATDRRILCHLSPTQYQGIEKFTVECIHLVGPVQRDRGDAPIAAEQHGIGHKTPPGAGMERFYPAVPNPIPSTSRITSIWAMWLASCSTARTISSARVVVDPSLARVPARCHDCASSC